MEGEFKYQSQVSNERGGKKRKEDGQEVFWREGRETVSFHRLESHSVAAPSAVPPLAVHPPSAAAPLLLRINKWIKKEKKGKEE